MFWGVRLQPGRKYSQEVSNAYQITKAVLETPVDGSHAKNSKRVHVMLSTGNEEFVLCTLDQGNVERNMDLFFSTGEKVCLFLKGEGNVHLTGYVVDPEVDEEDSDYEENPFVSAEDFAKAINGNKRAVKGDESSNKRAKLMNEDENDSDEEDEDFLGALDEEYDSMDDEDFDEMDDEMDGEESDDEEVPIAVPVKTKMNGAAAKKQTPQAQKGQQQQQQQQQKKGQQTPQAQKGQQQQQQQKKGQPTPQGQKGQQQKPNAQVQKVQQQQQGKKGVFTPPAKFVNSKTVDGMEIYDINSGSGPVAKRGKMVHVKYVGRLPNNKEFDRSTNKPFSFRLGDGEVIQGWDKGIEGMKVGGKRRLYIPPKLGYGNRGTGPIPGNSHLDFEVELVRVS